MSRRQLLAAAAIAPFASMTEVPSGIAPSNGATFVLVHGAWHGGWCWKKLAPLLRVNGHTVLTPTMTGLGERAHLLAPEVNLETHIVDIVAAVECEDVQRVVLVGHSYGGMVVTGVAPRIASRLSHIVYLDAFFPEDGKALKDYAPIPPTRADGWRIPPAGTPQNFGVKSQGDIAWVARRLGDQPLQTFTQPVRAPGETLAQSKQHFIQCTRTPWFAEAVQRGQRRGSRVHDLLIAGHDAMITEPAALAKILLNLEGLSPNAGKQDYESAASPKRS
jgi:pimeloyl-ACP methyl ester carboxylesterase